MVTRCPGCAKEVPEDDDVCPFCRRDFRQPVRAQRPSAPPQPPPKPQDPSSRVPEPLLTPWEPAPPSKAEEPIPELRQSPSMTPIALAMGVSLGALFFLTQKRRAEPPRDAAAVEAGLAAPASQAQTALKGLPDPPRVDLPRAAEPAPLPAPARRPAPRVRGEFAQMPPPDPEDWTDPGAPAAPIRFGGANAEIRIRGAVFDLVTLQPIADAELTLISVADGRRWITATDSSGRYRVTLAWSREGYDLLIGHPDYSQVYAPDPNAALRGLSDEERKKKAWDLARTLYHKELLTAPAGGQLTRDFVLVPKD